MSGNDVDAYGIECRICHSKSIHDMILSPCLCKGSMGCVHIGCLEQWLNVSSQAFCELCSFRFDVRQVRRYSLCQSIKVYFLRDKSTVYKAMLIVTLATINMCLVGGLWLMWFTRMPHDYVKEQSKINKAEIVDIEKKMAEEIENEEMGTAKWMVGFVFLSLMTLFSMKMLCVESYKVTRHQCRAWYRWWNETVNIHLVLDLKNYKITSKLDDLNDFSIKFANQEKQQNGYEEDKKQGNEEVEQTNLEEVKTTLPVDENGDDAKVIPSEQNTK